MTPPCRVIKPRLSCYSEKTPSRESIPSVVGNLTELESLSFFMNEKNWDHSNFLFLSFDATYLAGKIKSSLCANAPVVFTRPVKQVNPMLQLLPAGRIMHASIVCNKWQNNNNNSNNCINNNTKFLSWTCGRVHYNCLIWSHTASGLYNKHWQAEILSLSLCWRSDSGKRTRTCAMCGDHNLPK
jgi:hypothetical protein